MSDWTEPLQPVTLEDSGLDRWGRGWLSLINRKKEIVFQVLYEDRQKHAKYRYWSREHAMLSVNAYLTDTDNQVYLKGEKAHV